MAAPADGRGPAPASARSRASCAATSRSCPRSRWIKHADHLRFFLDETIEHYAAHMADLEAVLDAARADWRDPDRSRRLLEELGSAEPTSRP